MTTRLSRLVTLGAAGLLVVAGAAPAAAQDKVSIEMIQSGYTDNMQPYFDDLAARFMEANPDVDVIGPGRELERHLRRPQHAGRRRVTRPTS